MVDGGVTYKFVESSSFLELLVLGFEKEIAALLKNKESREGHEIKVSKGRKKLCLLIWRRKSNSLNVW